MYVYLYQLCPFISIRSVDIGIVPFFEKNFESTGSMTQLLTLISPWHPGVGSWSIEAISPELWKYELADCELPKISFRLSRNIVNDSNVDSFYFRKYRYNVISVIHLLRLMGGNLSTVLDAWWGIYRHPFFSSSWQGAITLSHLKNYPIHEQIGFC